MAKSSARSPEVDDGAGGIEYSRSRVHPLQINDRLARITIKYMVGTLEWSGLPFQAVSLFVSAVYDPYGATARSIVFGIALLHLGLVPLYVFGFGPFARGGWWMSIGLLQGLLVNGVLAALAAPMTYGTSLLCVPGCTYSGTAWLLLAFYPWLPSHFMRWRYPFEFILVGCYFAYFLLLARLENGYLSLVNVRSAVMSLLWLLVAYLIGKAIGRMCLAAAEKQLEVQQQSFSEFFDFLHSHVKASIAAVRMELSDTRRALEKLNELEGTISDYRVELLLAREQVPLATLFSERIRAFNGILAVAETPRVGGMTVLRPVGILVSRVLGDLLTNSAKYGARSVRIGCTIAAGMITIEVADDGPGFDAGFLNDESKSLSRLRRAARDLGGDLTLRRPDVGHGAILVLVAPLHVQERI